MGLAQILGETAFRVSGETGIAEVALSGGVWQNRRLLALTLAQLKRRNLVPLTHKLLSPNDECISAGQAFIGSLHWKGL
jgi:hydrogenase maturation protein HypF